MAPKKSTADKLYSGAASVGRISTLIGAVVATIVAALFIIASIYVFAKNPELKDKKTGKPMSKAEKHRIATIGLIVGVVILLFSWGIYYLTRKSKGFAAFEGVETVGNLIFH